MERSVGHALALLPAVNVVSAEPLHSFPPCGPEDEHGHADEGEEQHASKGHGEFKQLWGWEEIEHGSPHKKTLLYCANCEARGCNCPKKSTNTKQHHDSFMAHSSPHGLHQPRTNAAVSIDQQAGAEGYAVKQHLRLRVVWQGLL